ncbi:MAG: Lpg1974 family pore-forming outer membrane protein [Xanthobacteraceae bacterium]
MPAAILIIRCLPASGPRPGVKGEYSFGAFQLIGEAAAAGLIGTSKSHLDFTTSTPAVSPNAQAIFSPNSTQVIPSIDSRLAIAYSFSSSSHGQFKLEAGYKAAVYFNAVSDYAVTQITTTTPVVGVFLATEQHTFSNFTNQGPYMTGTWTF